MVGAARVSGRAIWAQREGAALTLAESSVIGAGFALPRDAGRRPAFQAVRAPFLPPRCAVSRADGAIRTVGVPGGTAFSQQLTGGLYLSGHHFFMGQTACERMAPEGVRWGAAGSRGAASRGGRRRRFRAGRTSPGLVATFPRGKPIFPASGHETAPRPSAAAKAPGGPERSGGGAQRLAFVDVDGHDALLLPEAGKSRFLFSWALRCERYRRALPHQPVSRPAGSNQPEARVLNTYAGLCLDGSLAVIDAQ